MNTNNINNDRIIKDIMAKAGTEEPSEDFTRRLMLMVRETAVAPSVVYRPLISRKAWALIFAACLAVLFLTIMLPGSPDGAPDATNKYYDMMNQFISIPVTEAINLILKISGTTVVLITSASAFVLLLFDYLLRKNLKWK